METEPNTSKMLLTVSSFGESLRRPKKPAEAVNMLEIAIFYVVEAR